MSDLQMFYSLLRTHTAATVIVQHTANGVTHAKRWAIEDAV